MVGLGAQRLTICRPTRRVQSILDLFAQLGYNPVSLPCTPHVSGDPGPADAAAPPRNALAPLWHDALVTSERIEFESDVFSPTGLTLLVDGSAQSHVDRDDPARLFFEYVRRIAHVLDAAADAGEPIRVLHLGGGAFTLPRYVAATRPGSTQLVVEHDAELVAVVLDRLPLPAGADIEILVGDARSAVVGLGTHPPFHVVVVDLYTGLDAPGFVDEPGFMAECLRLAGSDGLVVLNVADAPGLTRLRAQARALARADPAAELLVAGDPSMLSGAEEGNAVLVAGPGGLAPRVVDRLAAAGPFPVAVLSGHRLDAALWGAC